MNHYQIEKNSMYKKLVVFFATPANSAIWATFARLVTEITNFVSLNNTLTAYIQQHHVETQGVTQTKNDAFLAMTTLLVNKAQKASVWAIDTNNDNMAHVFDVQKSTFLGVSETKAFAMVKNVRDALNANIASMANVQLTTADITALDAAIAAYQKTIGTTGVAQSHKSEGAQGIESVIHSIDKSLDIIDKLIVSSYASNHADMVNEYHLNRSIDKLPTHHNGISIHVTNAASNADIEGATIALNGKTTTTDIEGLAEIIKIRPGIYNATISATGYAAQTIKVTIERGKVISLEVKLGK